MKEIRIRTRIFYTKRERTGRKRVCTLGNTFDDETAMVLVVGRRWWMKSSFHRKSSSRQTKQHGHCDTDKKLSLKLKIKKIQQKKIIFYLSLRLLSSIYSVRNSIKFGCLCLYVRILTVFPKKKMNLFPIVFDLRPENNTKRNLKREYRPSFPTEDR